MSYSATTYSRRGLDPLTIAWLSAGGNAPNGTISRMDDALVYARQNNLIWNGSAGLVRLNLFAGDALADALRPQIVQLGNATDTNSGFVGDNFRNAGPRGGLYQPGSCYLDTGVSGASLGTNCGGLGFLLSCDITSPSTEETYIGYQQSGISDYTRIRHYATNVLSGYWGIPNQNVASSWFPFSINQVYGLWAFSGGASQALMQNAYGYSGYVTPGTPASNYTIYVFALNNAGAAQKHLLETRCLSAYFIWKGENSAMQRIALVSMLQNFGKAMGRAEP